MKNQKPNQIGYFTKIELEQMLCALEYIERDGSYYGRKDYYWKRHESIKRKLEKLTLHYELTCRA